MNDVSRAPAEDDPREVIRTDVGEMARNVACLQLLLLAVPLVLGLVLALALFGPIACWMVAQAILAAGTGGP